ncbi:MAG: hypothetical protein JST01_13380 [Cyanobacteria bacterium SZAS TMP-1]|nr:hypothetical protein [Cyanobacteria bacterium SZAS TMP-1]
MSFENAQSRRSRFYSLAVLLILSVVALLVTIITERGPEEDAGKPMEAAAQAVARDLSALVIYHPKFGIVGLTDLRPPGSDTADGESEKAPFVIGINTIFGSVRQDLIRADFGRDDRKRRALVDEYQACIEAQSTLLSALRGAVEANGTGIDSEGHLINPTEDAINAYNSNVGFLHFWQRQKLLANSVKITLIYKSGQTALREPIIVKVEAIEERSKTLAAVPAPDRRKVTATATIDVSDCAAIAQTLENQTGSRGRP